MANHSDPTANAAVGAVNREWKQMVRKVLQIRRTGRDLTPEEKAAFIGIYRRLLDEPERELEKLRDKGA